MGNEGRLLDAALAYAARGWPVFPLRAREKTPLTAHGFLDASTDESTIRGWWQRWSSANVGIACGHGCDVIDVDGPEGRKSFADLVADLHLDPAQWVGSSSGRADGGNHYWFAASGRDRWRGMRAHLDFLGRKGYVVAPPSIHPSGRVYRWHQPSPGELPPVPAELLAVLDAHEREQKSPLFTGVYEVSLSATEHRPGDDYNRRCNWLPDLLEDLGWRIDRRQGRELLITRPGKKSGISATINHYGSNELHVFSAAPECKPFEADQCYTPFEAYTLIHHNGDFSAAAKDLREQGYGEQRQTRQTPPPPPLASPDATVAELIDVLGSYQHLDDTGHVWFALAVAVSGEAEVEPFLADPLWGMLVGPSSSGKTETARALGNIAGYLDDLTNAALLSFTKGKNPKQTGVLERIGERGTVIIGDFSTVLAMSNRGAKDQLFATLRRAYDGSVDRAVGNMQQPLRWRGRLTILACCTPIIDDYTSHADSLGPRWLYYRLKPRSIEGMRAMAKAARIPASEGRDRAAELTQLLISQASGQAASVTIPTWAADAITELAIVACYGRAAVPRSSYGKREITGEATREEPARLTKQLRQLVHALLALGATIEQAVELARRCALDSMPQTRRRALELFAAGVELTASEVARELGCDRRVARFALEEMAAAGVLEWPESYTTENDADEGDRWAPRSWRLEGSRAPLFMRILTAQPWEQKVHLQNSPPPSREEETIDQPHTSTFMSQGPPAAEGLFEPPPVDDPRRYTQ